MSPPRLVVFDLDGTLADSHAAILACFGAALAACGRPPVPEAEVTRRIGLPLVRIFAEVCPGDAAAHAALVAAYRDAWWSTSPSLTRAFDGVPALVGALRARGVSLAVATSKARAGALRTLDDIGLRRAFSLVLGVDCGPPPKPHPAFLAAALRAFDCPPAAALMVGDATFDVEMAVAAGVPALGVAWGAHSPAALHAAGARAVCADVPALARALGVAA